VRVGSYWRRLLFRRSFACLKVVAVLALVSATGMATVPFGRYGGDEEAQHRSYNSVLNTRVHY
jgi:hypothetical protein